MDSAARVPETVKNHLAPYVTRGQTVCAALSGGADSVCLLCALLAVRETLAIRVSAAHVHHHLRGEEADRDAAFCQALCQEKNIKLYLFDVDVTAYQKTHRGGTEETARILRYDALSRVEADYIATAHTASDNLETFLFRLMRGTSLHGLCGIPPVRGKILRPMLDVTRKDVLAYLASIGQPFVNDSSNDTENYTRNRIRHRVVPQITTIAPATEKHVARTLRTLRREDDFLIDTAKKTYTACRTALDTLTGIGREHPAVQGRVLAYFLTDLHFSVNNERIEGLLNILASGGTYSLGRDAKAVSQDKNLCIICAKPPQPPAKIPLSVECCIQYGKYTIKATVYPLSFIEKQIKVQKKFPNDVLDYDKIRGTAYFTPIYSGATMCLVHRDFTSSVKKALQSVLPPEERADIPLMIDDAGVCFVPFLGADERVKIDENTVRILRVEIRKDGQSAWCEKKSQSK